MTITLETIKAEQTKLAPMIETIEEDMKKNAFFEYQGKRVPLAIGEKYIGTIISADGTHNHHIILLPGAVSGMTWKDAKEWAESIGGELPDRIEGALLFATMKDEFEEEWYWTREADASDSGSAWYQYFDNGIQYYDDINHKLRARAVRRLIIQ
jgi:hypothetical protein